MPENSFQFGQMSFAELAVQMRVENEKRIRSGEDERTLERKIRDVAGQIPRNCKCKKCDELIEEKAQLQEKLDKARATNQTSKTFLQI